MLVKNGMVENKYNNYNDKLDNYFENQKTLINELLRVTKKHIFYNIQMLGNNKIDFLKLLGYFNNKIKDIIIWQKKWNTTYRARSFKFFF